jgi:hypothetical protein
MKRLTQWRSLRSLWIECLLKVEAHLNYRAEMLLVFIKPSPQEEEEGPSPAKWIREIISSRKSPLLKELGAKKDWLLSLRSKLMLTLPPMHSLKQDKIVCKKTGLWDNVRSGLNRLIGKTNSNQAETEEQEFHSRACLEQNHWTLSFILTGGVMAKLMRQFYRRQRLLRECVKILLQATYLINWQMN